MAQVLGEQIFGEGVVPCGNGSVGSEKSAGTDQLKRLVEVKMLVLHILAQPLQACECGMALVKMVDGGIEPKLTQGPYAADTQQYLLLEAVLPVSSVELMGDLAVFGSVGLEVGIEQIKIGTSHRHLPDTGAHLAAGHGHLDGTPVAVLVKHGLGGNLKEVLGVVLSYLVALGRDTLGKVAVAVQQAHRHHINVHVGAFLQVVTCEDAQAAGINLERRLQAVLHTEVSDGRIGTLALEGHIAVELVHHRAQA